MTNIDYFEGVIGQKQVKKTLSFYIKAYNRTNIFRNCLFFGAKGNGKTYICRKIAESLQKKYVEINCASLGKIHSFLNNVVIPHFGEPVTILLDEVHTLDKSVTNFLLSALAPNKECRNEVDTGDFVAVVDFRLVTILAATTEMQQVFIPLKNRLTQVALIDYNRKELSQILQINSPNVTFTKESLEYIVQFLKINARSAAMMGRDIVDYCEINKDFHFRLGDAKELISTLDIFPLGLTRFEFAALKYLAEVGEASLAMLASKSGLTRSAQQNLEYEFLSHGLAKIDGKRIITRKGRDYVDAYKNFNTMA